MGFKCQKCNETSQPYEKQNKVVVEKREKSYRYFIVKVRLQRNKTKEINTEIKPDERDRNKQLIREFTSKGWEIVKEQICCERCANIKERK